MTQCFFWKGTVRWLEDSINTFPTEAVIEHHKLKWQGKPESVEAKQFGLEFWRWTLEPSEAKQRCSDPMPSHCLPCSAYRTFVSKCFKAMQLDHMKTMACSVQNKVNQAFSRWLHGLPSSVKQLVRWGEQEPVQSCAVCSGRWEFEQRFGHPMLHLQLTWTCSRSPKCLNW